MLFFSWDKYYKILRPKYFSFSRPNRILSLITFRTNIGHYDFDMAIYVTMINLTAMECILLLLKGCLILCLCVLESLTLDKSK